MRHERTDTTENIYQQILLPSVRTTLDAIHAKLSKKEGLAPVPNPDGPSAPVTAAMPDASKDDVIVMPAVRAEEDPDRSGNCACEAGSWSGFEICP